ncbi:phosphatidylserine decarboxylase family protein [Desulfogranum japonicum]|uniref:phosphatidylserine decarboxylase family protein n=1 Tax=Desulfogranum japonicum TaxID=231447 RepID=UPI0003FC08AB|nr:phosphatidylserine decarboxylase family protein [Desulfogranum japonicum]
MEQPHIPVHKEGLPFIGLFAFTSLIFALVGCSAMALLALASTFFATYFFRDPSRIVPDKQGGIISPADGKVIRIEEVDDNRFLNQKVQKISIFMNVFNVHVNRLPVRGTIEAVHLQPGRFYAADKDKAVLHNEYCAMIVQSEGNVRYCVVQIAGLIARRIVCFARPGDTLESGQRYGLIRFGSRVDLYLPETSEITVKVGQKVKAGETILGSIG